MSIQLVFVTDSLFKQNDELAFYLRKDFAVTVILTDDAKQFSADKKIQMVMDADLVVVNYPSNKKSDERAALTLVRASTKKPMILLGLFDLDIDSVTMLQVIKLGCRLEYFYPTSDLLYASINIARIYEEKFKNKVSS